MYTAFYGLKEKPFALSPDPKYLFLSEAHREALAHLLYGIEQGEGFIAITGEVGTGKTTLCRTLLQRLGSDTEVAFIFNPELDATELLQTVTSELGMDTAGKSRRELVEQLNRFLLRKKEEGRRVLLIIDEAQNLTLETLEQIRLLSNLETETSKLIQILLLGQPELDVKLDLEELRQLKQRITVRWRLEPLSQSETRSYVRHRLRIAAGAERDIFSVAALREVHRRARGIPRLVNVLCDRVLLAGYAAQSMEIGASLVSDVDREVRGPSRAVIGQGNRYRALNVASMLLLGLSAGLLALLLFEGVDLGSVFRGGEPAEATASEVPEPAPAPAPQANAPAEPRPRTAAAVNAPAKEPVKAERRVPPPAARPVAVVSPEPAPARAAAAPRVAPTPSTPTRQAGSAPIPAAQVASVTPTSATAAATAVSVSAAELAQQLQDVTPAATASWAVDAMLEAWGMPPEALRASSVRQALDVLYARGLGVSRIAGANLAQLQALNHPAILALAVEGGAPRYVAVGAMNAYDVTVVGLPTGTVTLRAGEITERVVGDAYVIWRDFEQLPDVMGPWNEGEQVVWLQRALAQIGLFPHPPTGAFDSETIQAVRELQERFRLSVDGTVGPLTKMALYGSITQYAVPRLTRPAAAGEVG